MLESMRRIFERIDELNGSFRGMAPRKARRERSEFDAALTEARQAGLAAADPTAGKPMKTIASNPVGAAAAPGGVKDPEQYLPLVDKYAAKYGIDAALVRQVIAVESGYDDRSVSDKGAMGLMQLMPETAREMGVTNPFDPEENISGGTRYLSQLLKQNGGNLRLALASYNAGPGAVRQFGGVPPYPETQAFVRKVLSGLDSGDDTATE
ncbi:MAG TPA: lytic transglycosylase domain-containing protein [Candidatus Ozemobacteraceae bacterium]|mgnify:CR=1 FL=1|nr:lytic transglycosylase domain-containing protein [Candidatus Ozemobacteraceae bacterium]